MTATFRCEKRFDLNQLRLPRSRSTSVNGISRSFASVVQRIPITSKRTVTALVYASGRVVLVGGRSVGDLQQAITRFLLQHNTRLEEPLRISNYALHFHTNRPLNLVKLYDAFRKNFENVHYEVELFPSLNASCGRARVIVFHTGKVLITGVQSVNDAEIVRERVRETIN